MDIDAATIAGITPAPYAGPAWRHTSPRRDPLSGEGARIHGGRFNPPDSYPVIYLCLTRACAVTEFLRMANRQTIGPQGFLPWRVHQFHVDVGRVLDLTDSDVCDQIGVAEADLIEEDVTLTREIGVIAHGLSLQAIRSPSATGTDHVLALIPENLGAGTLRVERSDEWTSLEQL